MKHPQSHFAPARLHRKMTNPSNVKGFSLVEVVLAIGVVAFAFVALLGLLPAGLTNFRKAMDASIGSEIGQRVMDDVQQTDFNGLLAETNPPLTTTLNTILQDQSNPPTTTRVVAGQGSLQHRFFDDQGNEVILNPGTDTSATAPDPNSAQRNTNHILYDVHIQIILQGQLPSAVGSGSGGNAATGFLESPSLANVLIQVANNPGGAILPEILSPTTTTVPYATYSGYIYRNAKPISSSSGGS